MEMIGPVATGVCEERVDIAEAFEAMLKRSACLEPLLVMFFFFGAIELLPVQSDFLPIHIEPRLGQVLLRDCGS